MFSVFSLLCIWKRSITLLNLDRTGLLISALNERNASLDQLGSYVLPYLPVNTEYAFGECALVCNRVQLF